MSLDALDFHLVNDWQRDFPLVSRPYAELAHRLGISEAEVISRLRQLAESGTVSRIGAVFRPHTLGWSTLAAVAVAPDRIESVAKSISAYSEINHNYEREHDFNLWFVATAPTRERVAQVLDEIGELAGGPVLDLPMQEDFHIDLGFDLLPSPPGGGAGGEGAARIQRATPIQASFPLPSPPPRGEGARRPHLDPTRRRNEPEEISLEPADYTLASALEGGLTLSPRPYAALATRLGWREEAVLTRLARLIDLGVIRRFGIVVRHRELGYHANAMVVWDVPDAEVPIVGRALAGQRAVTLCYQRPRCLPHWRYNLFSMLHGQDRGAVLEELARLRGKLGLDHLVCEPLFSHRRFKQCGARYSALAKVA
ncbi:MAG: AsnC family transcriptional regulator [Gallionellaceae bacterium]|nr:AsnC family transcriptional regulator [Gallionellaceae bacterium]